MARFDGRANLRPANTRTKEERSVIARKAGKASGESRKNRKAFKEGLLDLLSLPMKEGKVTDKIGSLMDFKTANVTVRERILVALAMKAAKGDVKAAEFIRDTIGEAPVQEMKVDSSTSESRTDEELMKIINGK